MKILFFSHSSGLGGGERSLLELIDELSELSIQSYVILPNDGPLVNYLDRKQIPHQIVNFRLWVSENKTKHTEIIKAFQQSILNLKLIIPQLRQINPDFVYTNTLTHPWGAIAASLLHKPHCWHIREYGILDHNFIFEIGYRPTMQFIEQYSDFIICNSENIQKHVHRYIKKNSILARNYLSIPPSSIKRKITNPFHSPKTTKIILCGTIISGKGQFEAVKAVKLLTDQNLPVELLLIGRIAKIRYWHKIQTYIKNHHLEKNIIWQPNTENPYPYIKLADIVVVPSKNEAYGRITVESMLLGKPVIGSNTGFNPYIIQNDINGYLYQHDNIEDLTEKIKRLMHREKSRQLGSNASLFIQNFISKDQYGYLIGRHLFKSLDIKDQVNKKANPLKLLFNLINSPKTGQSLL